MKSAVEFCMLCLLTVIPLSLLIPTVAAQEGPGIAIAHPGQNVELLCTVTVTSNTQAVAWLINNMRDNMGPYSLNTLRAGLLAGYTGVTDTDSNNLIVENITINDDRNGSDYRCVIVPAQGTPSLGNIIEGSDPTILYVAGVPAMVPGVTVDNNTININGNNVTLTLSWGEPFDNLDPVVNYTVSCSGDVTCPPNFTTTDSTTRSYTVTNLIPMSNYIFSVVATNSIGSGEFGVVMISTPGEIIPGAPDIVPDVTVDKSTINVNRNNVTLILSWGEPFNNLDPIVNYFVSCSGDDACPPNFTTTDATTRSHTITNLTPLTNYTFSVVATNSIGNGEAGVVMVNTPGVPAMVPDVTVDGNIFNINGNNVTLILSWGEPFNNHDPIVNYTVSCSGDDTCPPNFTTTDNITRSHTITNLTPMTNYAFSVVATNSIGSGEAGVVMITTPGIPDMVPDVTVDDDTININGNNVTLTLSWEEPFNNLDPIVNYTVSCSGDDACPQNFTTTDNATRSYTITTNLTPMTNYTFSVVATNSIGSGEAGVVTITTPGVPALVSNIRFVIKSVDAKGNTVTLTLSWKEPFNNLDPIVNYTVSCSGDNACPPNFTTTDNTTRNYTITNLNPMTNYTFSVVATNSIGSGKAGVVMITTPSIGVNTTSSTNEWIIIIIIIFFLILACCGCTCIMFCVCCKQRENHYQSEKFCANPRSSFVVFVILGILTFGISLLIWYIYLKCQSNEKDNYCKITNVSILVLGIYTCGISILLWWMYKAITECNISTSEDSSVAVSYQRRQANEVPSVFNQLAEYDDIVHVATSPTESIQKSAYIVPDSTITDKTDKRLQIPPSYAAVSTEDVIARERAAASALQASIQHQITASGEKYALPDKLAAKNKPIIAHQKDTTDAQQAIQRQNTAGEGKYALPEVVAKDKSIKYVKMDELSTLEKTNTNEDAFTPYAEIC